MSSINGVSALQGSRGFDPVGGTQSTSKADTQLPPETKKLIDSIVKQIMSELGQSQQPSPTAPAQDASQSPGDDSDDSPKTGKSHRGHNQKMNGAEQPGLSPQIQAAVTQAVTAAVTAATGGGGTTAS